MRLDTCITIDGQSDRFASSPTTLRTNVLVTLVMKDIGHGILKKLDQALRTKDAAGFRFAHKGLSVTADPAVQIGGDVALGSDRLWDRSRDRAGSASAI